MFLRRGLFFLQQNTPVSFFGFPRGCRVSLLIKMIRMSEINYNEVRCENLLSLKKEILRFFENVIIYAYLSNNKTNYRNFIRMFFLIQSMQSVISQWMYWSLVFCIALKFLRQIRSYESLRKSHCLRM